MRAESVGAMPTALRGHAVQPCPAKAVGRARFFVCLAFLILPGCARRGAEAIPLTMVSPHRDEIRAETAEAFAAWFRDRTHERGERALAAVKEWHQQPEKASAVEQACTEVLADWRPEDATAIRDAFTAWRQNPTSATAD